MKENENKLVPVNNSLVSIERQIAIGDKIINQKIEELFNRAFKLINSKNIDSDSNYNYLADFLQNESLLNSEIFLFLVQNEQDYVNALEIFDNIIKIDSNFKFAYYFKGIIYQKLILVQESISSFSTALLIDDEFVCALIKRVELYEIYNYELALNDWNKLILLRPNNYDYYYKRAYILFLLNNISESKKDILFCYKLEPNNIPFNTILGRILEKMGEEKLAKEIFIEVIELSEKCLIENPNNYKLYYYIGYAQRWLKKNNEALLSLNKCIEINKNYASALILRADVNAILRKYSASIDDMLEYLVLNPLDFTVYNSLGFRYTRLNNFIKANECFTKSFEMNIYKNNPVFANTFKFRSKMKQDMGDRIGSREDFNNYLKFS